MLSCRYKSLSFQLKIGFILYVTHLYFNQALILLKMSYSMYLFRTNTKHTNTKLFGEVLGSTRLKVELCIKLAPSSSVISSTATARLFGIELAYSHSVLFRLFYGLMAISYSI
eukprot:UN2237